jgi:hypothetical protein
MMLQAIAAVNSHPRTRQLVLTLGSSILHYTACLGSVGHVTFIN